MRRPDRIELAFMAYALSGLIGLAIWTQPALGQAEADAALKDRVGQLVDRLEDPKPEVRDEAQARLIKLGAKILPLLPDPSAITGKDRIERLEKIRSTLEEEAEEANSGASLVTIQAKGIRLSEALQQLQRQTGNPITDIREQLGGEVTNPAFDLDLKDVTFLEALDRVAKLADVTTTPATADGTIGIMGGTPPKEPLVRYVGPFRVAFRQFAEVRDLQSGTASANAQLEVAWEPRLRPMLLTLKAEELEIKDDQGREVKPQSMMESNEVVLRPENPAAELNLNLDAPDRTAKKLSRFRVKADVTIPARMKTFRFPSLAQENVTIKQGDVSATLQGTEVDEQVWKVNLQVAYPDNGPVFESFRQGLFNNRIWLQKADGSRFEHNGGSSDNGMSDGRLSFEYLFVDAPGKPADYQLVYEAPSKVITMPLEVEFADVSLP